MVVLDKVCNELIWWNIYFEVSYNVISYGEFIVVMLIDVLFIGWGCVLNDISIGGYWIIEEVKNYINYLEFLVIYLVFKFFLFIINGQYVKFMVDNMIVLFDVNYMGISSFEKRNDLVKEIWLWCV